MVTKPLIFLLREYRRVLKPEVAVVVIEAQVLFAVNSEFSKLCLLITFLSKLFGFEFRLNMDRKYSELE